MLQAYRSYYLIYNKFSGDIDGDYVIEGVAPFLPSNLFKKTKISNTTAEAYTHTVYPLTVKPFNDSTLKWDFNNWITWGENSTSECMYLSIQGPKGKWNSENVNAYIEILKKHYPLYKPQPLFFRYGADNFCFPFPEFPPTSKLDSVSKNRYY